MLGQHFTGSREALDENRKWAAEAPETMAPLLPTTKKQGCQSTVAAVFVVIPKAVCAASFLTDLLLYNWWEPKLSKSALFEKFHMHYFRSVGCLPSKLTCYSLAPTLFRLLAWFCFSTSGAKKYRIVGCPCQPLLFQSRKNHVLCFRQAWTRALIILFHWSTYYVQRIFVFFLRSQ